MLVNGDLSFENYLSYREIYEDLRELEQFIDWIKSRRRFIDSHDLVIRLNHAKKTDGYGVDVGVKTDIRFVNSLLLKQNKFDYFNPKNMYQSKETTYVTFEVSRFNQGFLHWTITQKSFIDRYFKQRVFNKDQKFYMLDYRSLWSMQRWLSSLGKYPILNFIPSSGFIAFQTMLSHCDIIRLFEFIPSKRLTNLCHYFEKRRSITCTYAGDHSVSAEKLSYYFMGNRNRVEIFDKGYVTNSEHYILPTNGFNVVFTRKYIVIREQFGFVFRINGCKFTNNNGIWSSIETFTSKCSLFF
ncbi:unnamed protein product [Lepeophtheirus salmonis]|uniref:beta-galactoside alpha-(2,6)-sialyltransferase n=1 Tax=Lepeophtheirus salmonis TaxID=72036 RepID=A0A7R8HAY1_LEPSM|nr:unnamed protein product [Lepeophtheirus salmonis]CAF2982533.1 unnamed protein product [Lepeophtheirus salmonis]